MEVSANGSSEWTPSAVNPFLGTISEVERGGFFALGSVGFVLNAVFLVVLLKYFKRSYIIVINVAATDVVGSIAIFLDRGIHLPPVPRLPIFAQLYCRLWVSEVFFWGARAVTSYLFLVAAVDRVIAVFLLQHYKVYVTANRLLGGCLAAWLVGMLMKSDQIFLFQPWGPVCFWAPSAAWLDAYTAWGSLFDVLVPSIFIMVANLAIHLRINRMTFGAKYRNQTYTMLAVSVAYCLCWLPNTVAYVMLHNLHVGEALWELKSVRSGAVWLGFLNSLVNPFIFWAMSTDFKLDLVKFTRWTSETETVTVDK